MTTTPLLRRVVLFGTVAILLSGCFRVESSFDISDDGTADVEVLTAVDVAQLGQLADLFGEDVSGLADLSGQDLIQELTEGTDPCGDLAGSAVGLDVTTSEIDDGDLRGVGCTIEDVPIEELTEVGEDSALAITQSGEETTFDLRVGGVSELTAATSDVPVPIPGFDLDELVEIRFRATAPGSLDEHNATETNGSTAVWVVTADAPFIEGDTAVMTASWAPDDDSTSGVLIALIVALVVVGLLVAGGLLLLPRLRRAGDSPGSGTVEPEPPFPTPGATPPAPGGPGPLPPAPPPPDLAPPSAPPVAPGDAPPPPPVPPAPPPPDGPDAPDDRLPPPGAR